MLWPPQKSDPLIESFQEIYNTWGGQGRLPADVTCLGAVTRQVAAPAHKYLGYLLQYERKGVDGAAEAYRAAIKADPGYAPARTYLGLLLYFERKDVDGATEAYRTLR